VYEHQACPGMPPAKRMMLSTLGPRLLIGPSLVPIKRFA